MALAASASGSITRELGSIVDEDIELGDIVVVKPNGEDGPKMPLAVGREVIMGRDETCDIRVRLNEVSRHHLTIFTEDGTAWILNKSVSAATILNGIAMAVNEPMQLPHGAIFIIQTRTFRFDYRPEFMENLNLHRPSRPQRGVDDFKPKNGDVTLVLSRPVLAAATGAVLSDASNATSPSVLPTPVKRSLSKLRNGRDVPTATGTPVASSAANVVPVHVLPTVTCATPSTVTRLEPRSAKRRVSFGVDRFHPIPDRVEAQFKYMPTPPEPEPPAPTAVQVEKRVKGVPTPVRVQIMKRAALADLKARATAVQVQAAPAVQVQEAAATVQVETAAVQVETAAVQVETAMQRVHTTWSEQDEVSVTVTNLNPAVQVESTPTAVRPSLPAALAAAIRAAVDYFKSSPTPQPVEQPMEEEVQVEPVMTSTPTPTAAALSVATPTHLFFPSPPPAVQVDAEQGTVQVEQVEVQVGIWQDEVDDRYRRRADSVLFTHAAGRLSTVYEGLDDSRCETDFKSDGEQLEPPPAAKRATKRRATVSPSRVLPAPTVASPTVLPAPAPTASSTSTSSGCAVCGKALARVHASCGVCGLDTHKKCAGLHHCAPAAAAVQVEEETETAAVQVVDYSGMRVPELREECVKRGLDSKGVKSVLIQRLMGEAAVAQPAPTRSTRKSVAPVAMEEEEEAAPVAPAAGRKRRAAEPEPSVPLATAAAGRKKARMSSAAAEAAAAVEPVAPSEGRVTRARAGRK